MGRRPKWVSIPYEKTARKADREVRKLLNQEVETMAYPSLEFDEDRAVNLLNERHPPFIVKPMVASDREVCDNHTSRIHPPTRKSGLGRYGAKKVGFSWAFAFEMVHETYGEGYEGFFCSTSCAADFFARKRLADQKAFDPSSCEEDFVSLAGVVYNKPLWIRVDFFGIEHAGQMLYNDISQNCSVEYDTYREEMTIMVDRKAARKSWKAWHTAKLAHRANPTNQVLFMSRISPRPPPATKKRGRPPKKTAPPTATPEASTTQIGSSETVTENPITIPGAVSQIDQLRAEQAIRALDEGTNAHARPPPPVVRVPPIVYEVSSEEDISDISDISIDEPTIHEISDSDEGDNGSPAPEPMDIPLVELVAEANARQLAGPDELQGLVAETIERMVVSASETGGEDRSIHSQRTIESSTPLATLFAQLEQMQESLSTMPERAHAQSERLEMTAIKDPVLYSDLVEERAKLLAVKEWAMVNWDELVKVLFTLSSVLVSFEEYRISLGNENRDYPTLTKELIQGTTRKYLVYGNKFSTYEEFVAQLNHQSYHALPPSEKMEFNNKVARVMRRISARTREILDLLTEVLAMINAFIRRFMVVIDTEALVPRGFE